MGSIPTSEPPPLLLQDNVVELPLGIDEFAADKLHETAALAGCGLIIATHTYNAPSTKLANNNFVLVVVR